MLLVRYFLISCILLALWFYFGGGLARFTDLPRTLDALGSSGLHSWRTLDPVFYGFYWLVSPVISPFQYLGLIFFLSLLLIRKCSEHQGGPRIWIWIFVLMSPAIADLLLSQVRFGLAGAVFITWCRWPTKASIGILSGLLHAAFLPWLGSFWLAARLSRRSLSESSYFLLWGCAGVLAALFLGYGKEIILAAIGDYRASVVNATTSVRFVYIWLPFLMFFSFIVDRSSSFRGPLWAFVVAFGLSPFIPIEGQRLLSVCLILVAVSYVRWSLSRLMVAIALGAPPLVASLYVAYLMMEI